MLSPRAPGIIAAAGAQLLSTTNVAGNDCPGTPPLSMAQYVEPSEKKGMAVTLATPTRIASAPVAWTASSKAS